MSDIVERLRDVQWWESHCELRRQAADEIERLRAGYERLERIIIKRSLTADERASDALAFVRYINAACAALEEK